MQDIWRRKKKGLPRLGWVQANIRDLLGMRTQLQEENAYLGFCKQPQ